MEGDPEEKELLPFVPLVTLEPAEDDVYLGHSPRYPWGRVYGGLVVAQALRAACHSVPEGFAVHSLHAYFILGGTHDEPIRYEVDRIRNGRSFTTRRVVAHQSSGAILNLSASFHKPEEDASVQLANMPEGLPAPETLRRDRWNDHLENHVVPQSPERKGHIAAWIRVPDCPPDDPALQTCALAYASDELPTMAAISAHPRGASGFGTSDSFGFFTTSLDHAIWFHRPFRADQFMLHDMECHVVDGARALTIARIFDRDGRHVASLTQESLLRSLRDEAER